MVLSAKPYGAFAFCILFLLRILFMNVVNKLCLFACLLLSLYPIMGTCK